MKFTILVFLFPLLSYASTQFMWKKNLKNPLQGDCFEVDSETLGKKFIQETKNEKCKPEKTFYSFNFKNSFCYEVDSQTNGKQYISRVNISNCKTKNIKTTFYKINGNTACYELDLESLGKKYYKKLRDNECEKLETKEKHFLWKSTSQFAGICFQKKLSLNESINIKTKTENCRPKETIFKFVKENGFFKGNCFEVHPETSEKYINKVNIQKCKTSQTVYIFYKKEGTTIGNCYEIDAETKGEQFIDTVDSKYCKELL